MRTKAQQVVIIGAGQAGLAAAYYLQQADIDYVVLGKEKRIGDSWRQRYDSLKLFTPRWYSQLPGLSLAGDPDQYPTKDDIADYLECYAKRFELNIELETDVYSLTRVEENFRLHTNRGLYVAQHVIIATGPFHTPSLPSFSSHISNDIRQLHSSQYRSPSDLKPGTVLIVGGGNSGAQIAVELSNKRDVILSINRRLVYFPLQLGKRSIFWWLDKLGLLHAPVEGTIGQLLKKKGDPIFGIELKKAIRQGAIQLKPKAVASHNNQIELADHSKLEVQNIIWATGYNANYSWINLPEAKDDAGNLNHVRGVTSVDGLYALGLPWQSHRGSALIGGVGKDARYICSLIIRKLDRSF